MNLPAAFLVLRLMVRDTFRHSLASAVVLGLLLGLEWVVHRPVFDCPPGRGDSRTEASRGDRVVRPGSQAVHWGCRVTWDRSSSPSVRSG